MSIVNSACCEFNVGYVESADAYCYVCSSSHFHQHLDLRALRQKIFGKVVSSHNINWEELRKDKRKIGSLMKGNHCQTLATELQAICEHGNDLFFEGKRMSLHVCFSSHGEDDGLDFTFDICTRESKELKLEFSKNAGAEFNYISEEINEISQKFNEGDILEYHPSGIFKIASLNHSA